MKQPIANGAPRPATLLVAILSAAICISAPALGAEAAGPAHMDHAHMHHADTSGTLQVSRVDYTVPDLVLKDEDGRNIRLRELFASGQPVVVNFIYTSCTTLCPVMTATMLQMQRQLPDPESRPRYVSVSIDPEYDTSRVLRDYAARMQADWTFLTGERDDVQAVLRAFSAWRGAKTNHFALTLMHRPGEPTWTRVEGLGTASQLAALWRAGAT